MSRASISCPPGLMRFFLEFNLFQCGIETADIMNRQQTMKTMFSFIRYDFPHLCDAAQVVLSRNPLIHMMKYIDQIKISFSLSPYLLSGVTHLLKNLNFVAVEVIIYTMIIYFFVYAMYTHLRLWIMQNNQMQRNDSNQGGGHTLKTPTVSSAT